MAKQRTKAKRKTVVSASEAKPKKRAIMLNQNIVTDYLPRLEAALGDDTKFQQLFDTLKADPEVRQAEAVELASQFVAKTPNSTSRAKALERVYQRHASLANFRLKQRAMSGRSAA